MLMSFRVKTWVARLTVAAILVQMSALVTANPTDAVLSQDSLAVRAGTGAPNSNCNVNSDCASGTCLDTTDFRTCDRLRPDGSVVECTDYQYGYGSSYCRGFDLGHKCANQGECRNGLCKRGTCVKTKVGQACKDDLGCSGSQVCTDGKCFAPAAGSLYPGEDCKVGSSCKSGRCTTQLEEDSYAPYFLNFRLKCDYFALNQTGCRTFTDCRTGLCQNGACKLGADGDRCVFNSQCVNVCGTNGVCFTPNPKKLLSPDQPCKNGTDCLSGACYQTQGGDFPFTRPDFTNPGHNYTYYYDGRCGGSLFNGKCRVSNDCAQGTCKSGVCKGAALGAKCTQDKACQSLTCIPPNNGTCVISQSIAPCSSNSDCFSNDCSNSSCYWYQRICPEPHCQALGEGKQCRVTGDCNASYYACIDGTCQNKYGPGR
ncbi:hypothetical protein OC846_004673 [Tilletia horrida]|uniref:Dickkopf N-terminal cysteine-rich domain-containing protein n=1 Tax=Tilletia horrida TaxID=155126 RepID=A0AAN6GRZ3_9BASI|nr:hypothetical protein OC846_004673 [Tilletia horrida]KAK0554907.1 hypothetical protein OC845_000548 [Tilletia horrida]KAK0565175.1 hypothetical protein OC861_003910 [Tilletia horrida]